MIYKVDTRRRTYGELWRIHRPRLGRFLSVAAGKLLGIPQPYTFGIRRPERLNLHEPEDLPAAVPGRVAAVVLACGELGFEFQFFASVDTMVGSPVVAYLAAMLHADGWAWATALAGTVRGQVRQVRFNCFSRLRDDRHVVTSDHAWTLTPHPADLPEFLPGAPPAAVVRRHAARLQAPDVWPDRAARADLPGVILAREQRHVDHGVEWGVYVPMTREEVDRLTGGDEGW